MSKILRRPMFRGGGKVSSYGNGIATGLADGGMPGKRGLVDGPGGYSGDEIDFNLFNKNYKDQDYYTNQQKYKTYIPKYQNQQDYLNAYNNRLAKQEDDLLMTMGVDDYSGFQDTIAEDLSYLRSSDGRNKYIDDLRTNQNKEIAKAAEYGLNKQTEFEKLLTNQTKNNNSQPDISAREAQLESYFAARNNKKSAKEQIAENKKIFEEAMGGGKKAMIEDLSNMGLSYAAGALKEGATVKSSFADFFEKESQRPSRKSKVSDAASQAAITAYLTGEKSFRDFENMLALNKAKVKDTIDIKEEYAKNLNITDRFATAKASGIDGKKAKYDFSIKSWMNDNKDSIDFKSGNVNYFKEEDVKVTEENVGEVFVDLDKNLIFMIVLESGVPTKKFLR